MSSTARTIPVTTRTETGKNAMYRLRTTGRVPGVVYGGGDDNVTFSLDIRDLMAGLHNESFYATVYELTPDQGRPIRALPKAVQFNRVTDQPIHVDFMRVTDKTKIKVSVPLHLTNTDKCRGLKAGGVLNVVRHTVEVLCYASKIPSHFEIDLLNAKIGDAIKSSILTLPEGVTLTITDRDFTLATVVAPKSGTAEEAGE
jgi:large subunit ribosomal protein L25